MRKSSQKRFPALAGGTALLILSGAAHAADVNGVFKLGYDSGGDTLTTALFTDGHTANIKANEGFSIGGGVRMAYPEKHLDTEITIAWKQESINATNGDIDFTRYPLELLVFYNLNTWRVGGGLTHHLNPKVSSSGAGTAFIGSGNYDNATGFVLQVDFLSGKQMAIGLRYTSIDYKPEGGGTSAKGDGVGFSLGFYF